MKAARILVPALGLLLAISAAWAQAQDGILLRYQFTPDETRAYDLNVTGGGRIVLSLPQLGDMNLPLAMTINGSFEMLTKGVDAEGNGEVSVSLGEMAMEVAVLDRVMHLTLDLEKGKVLVDGREVALPGAEAGEGSALSKLVFLLSPRGQLLDVQGVEEFTAALQRLNPAGPVSPVSPANLVNLKEMLQGYSPQLPEEPVKPGDTWVQTMKVPLPGQAEPTEMSTEFVLQKIGDIEGHRIARIGLLSAWTIKDVPLPAAAPDRPSPGRLDSLAVTAEGQIYHDADAGFMHSARLAVTMDMEMTGTAAGPLPLPAGDQAGAAPNPPGAGGPAPAAGENPPTAKISLKDMRLFYNIYPRGGVSAAAEE